MGIQKGISLIETLTKSRTFMKLARTATKGQCVVKNAEVTGRQAANFFEGMPIVSSLTRGIPTENLVIRYGTKGSKGSSVTGFHIFNGDSLIAKGAMGIDKTRGKEPILQLRWHLGENGKAAKMNLTYNGNNQFNGNLISNQVSHEGRFTLNQRYGDTFNLEYTESPLHFDLLTNSRGRSLRNAADLPNAHQFEQYQQEANKRVKNFVNGTKRKQPAGKRLKLQDERRYARKQKLKLKEDMQKKLAEVKTKYEPEISGLRAKIEGQGALKSQIQELEKAKKLARTECAIAIKRGNIEETEYNKIRDYVVSMIERNPEMLKQDIAKIRSNKGGISYRDTIKCAVADMLHTELGIQKLNAQIIPNVEINAAKQELKLLKKQLKLETREIQGLSSSKRRAVEPEKTETIDFSNVRFFSRKKSIQSILRNEGISLRSIPAYPNKEVLAQLKTVKGTPTEKIQQIKNIFCKEMGIDSSLVEICPVNGGVLREFPAQFTPATGKIIFDEELLSKLSTSQIAGLIRHELDHLEVFGKLSKSLEPKKFKELLINMSANPAERKMIAEAFNAEFYAKLGKQLSTQGFDSRLYEQAVRDYKGIQTSSITQTFKKTGTYYTNPLEKRAYDIEISLAKSLGSSDISKIVDIHTGKQIVAEIERIERIAPKGFDMDAYLTRIFNSVKTRMGNKIEINELNYNILQELRKV